MNLRHALGKNTEDEALNWLLSQGNYRLIQRGFRCKFGEIDLILEHEVSGNPELVFVEVRARKTGAQVKGLESVDWKKQSRLQRTVALFLAQYRGCARKVRLDLVTRDGESWAHLVNLW